MYDIGKRASERERGRSKTNNKNTPKTKRRRKNPLIFSIWNFLWNKNKFAKTTKSTKQKKLQSHTKQHTHEQANEQLIPTQLNKRNVL